jgi:predicted O-methyltransferase YrrM
MSMLFQQIDKYLEDLFTDPDPALKEGLEENTRSGLPAFDVSPLQGQFLSLLTRISRAKRILEIGTLGGISTLYFAKALPDDGKIITLDHNVIYLQVAKENIARAHLLDRVEFKSGKALDSLNHLIENKTEPFDIIFIDADKPNNPLYLEKALQLSKKGTILIGDNVIRAGSILDSESQNPTILGVRKFLTDLSLNENLSTTVLQTVGIKGHDGFSISIVK